VRARRHRCDHCRKTWWQDISKAAAPCAKISRRGLGWALTAVVVEHLTVTRAAAGLEACLGDGPVPRRSASRATRWSSAGSASSRVRLGRRGRAGDRLYKAASSGVPTVLVEIRRLWRALTQCAFDVIFCVALLCDFVRIVQLFRRR